MFYDLLLTLWQENNLSEDRLRKLVPMFITVEQADEIIAHPQNTEE
ncbi:hypothetical protein KR50_28240 [Jeotgalibacillus campisalis]|uniref:Uncharacterized protein n=1 Tax=Jeotgalibacillus campisalis TaxID=220754 RepID=A0A0C2RWM2_9BACL|nr:hypothetical protein KR50_28240 [Jeotgalibacillus campisalis]